MHIALYARVSTRNKDQNRDTQPYPFLELCRQSVWTEVTEYVDLASVTKVKNRAAWSRLLEDARGKKVDLISVGRMEQAFRSVLYAAQTFENLKDWNVGLKTYQDSWMDTTDPKGEMMSYITIAYAQVEKSLIAERVNAGMDRSARQGQQVGQPKVEDNPMQAQKLRQAGHQNWANR